MKDSSHIKPIQVSETLPTSFYLNREQYELQLSKIFSKSWQYLGDSIEYDKNPNNLFPVYLLSGSLSEPLLWSKTAFGLRLIPNVCTHRGFILVQEPKRANKIVCGYHGRRFNGKGEFEFMPEFKEVENFPRPCDHLKPLRHNSFDRFLFGTIEGDEEVWKRIQNFLNERLYFLDFSSFNRAQEYDQVYNVNAHWALYIDNYLEGFHIPFVHEELGAMIDYGSYSTICDHEVVLQVGYSSKGTEAFHLPQGHPDYGKDITAYYYWIYPNFMLNIYPWGVQLNVVKPMGVDFTKVEFLYFIKDQQLWERMGKDRIAEKTEREDEYVVESVQKGLKSTFYNTGRYSVKREKGVYHFHNLVKNSLHY